MPDQNDQTAVRRNRTPSVLSIHNPSNLFSLASPGTVRSQLTDQRVRFFDLQPDVLLGSVEAPSGGGELHVGLLQLTLPILGLLPVLLRQPGRSAMSGQVGLTKSSALLLRIQAQICLAFYCD